VITLWNIENPAAPPLHAEGDTLPAMFLECLRLRGERVAVRQKERGIWEQTTWREIGVIAREITGGLADLGLAPGEVVSILANSSREWLYADLGVLCAGGVTNGIYPTDASSQCEYILTDSSSVGIFLEDEEQLDKILLIRERLPLLRWIVVFDMKGLGNFEDPMVMGLEALRARGRAHAQAHPGDFERRAAARRPEDLAVLVYTSGTTGKAKGAMISHRNMTRSIHHSARNGFDYRETDETLMFLPMCHVLGRIITLLGVYTGNVTNFAERPDTVAENIREVAPTIMVSVPRLWEKFHSAVTLSVKEASPLQQAAYRAAMAIGLQVAECYLAGRPVPGWLKLRYRFAHWLVLDNVRRMVGLHRTRLAGTGAAPISPELIRWYLALGVPMVEAWGQTELSGVGTCNPITRIRIGSIGRAVSHVELRLSAEGELLVRGETVFMGYLNQPEKTAETLRDGWLHTGDVCTVDDDGYYHITDRMKDIIITAGGKNVTPSEIENELKFSPYITDAVVIGDRRPYLTALIMIDQDNVEQFAQDRSVPFSDFASLCRAPEVEALIASEVERVNRRFARVEQVKAFRLIDRQLTAEDEELTPTMKLKRTFVQRKYAELVASMYAEGKAA
jgi:long-chain acyl-CoA synthetase